MTRETPMPVPTRPFAVLRGMHAWRCIRQSPSTTKGKVLCARRLAARSTSRRPEDCRYVRERLGGTLRRSIVRLNEGTRRRPGWTRCQGIRSLQGLPGYCLRMQRPERSEQGARAQPVIDARAAPRGVGTEIDNTAVVDRVVMALFRRGPVRMAQKAGQHRYADRGRLPAADIFQNKHRLRCLVHMGRPQRRKDAHGQPLQRKNHCKQPRQREPRESTVEGENRGCHGTEAVGFVALRGRRRFGCNPTVETQRRSGERQDVSPLGGHRSSPRQRHICPAREAGSGPVG
jgi:hypothetical protein